MGTPKALLQLDGSPLIARHVAALTPFAERVIVVVGTDPRVQEAIPPGVETRSNPDWASTYPIDSLALALRSREPAACLVTPVDVAPPHPSTLEALLHAGAPAVPAAPDGSRGHPCLLDAELVAELCARPPAGGLRTLLTTTRVVPVTDPLVALDFDDKAAWSLFIRRWKKHRARLP